MWWFFKFKTQTHPYDKEIAICQRYHHLAWHIQVTGCGVFDGVRQLWDTEESKSNISAGLPVTDQSHGLQQPAHLSKLLIVGDKSEDDQVQEVEQEVEKKHPASELLPLLLQQPAQRLHLEHLVAVLGGDRCLSTE